MNAIEVDQSPPPGTIRLDIDGAVWRLTVASERRANALSPKMAGELATIWRDFEAQPDARVAIVRGAGERHFCAGAEMKALETPGGLLGAGRSSSITPSENDVSKPVIAALNGTVAGLGIGLIADADIVVAHNRARIIDPHISLGRLIGRSSLRIWRGVGFGEATMLALTGQPMTAVRAHELGLVQLLAESHDELDATVADLAVTVAAQDPALVDASLRLLRQLRNPAHYDSTMDELVGLLAGEFGQRTTSSVSASRGPR